MALQQVLSVYMHITLQASNFTVLVGEDFSGIPESLTFAERSVCIDIEILDDEIHELDEHISLEMVTAHLPSTEVGEVNVIISTAAEITIVEDDGELYIT